MKKLLVKTNQRVCQKLELPQLIRKKNTPNKNETKKTTFFDAHALLEQIDTHIVPHI